MAFLLRFNDNTNISTASYVNLTGGVAVPSASTTFKIIIEGSPAANVDHWRPLGTSASDGLNRVIVFANRTVTLSAFFSGQTNSWTSPIPISEIELMEFIKNSSGRLDLFINGEVVSGGFNNHSFGYNFTRIGANFNTGSRAFDLKRLQFKVDDVIIHDYDPSASNGTGSTLIDIVGANNGTLVNFPTDDSQWVFYGEPSSDVDSTVAATWPIFGVAAEQSTVSAGVNSSIAATWPLFNVSSAQVSTVPVYDSTINATWPLFSVTASQSAAAPVYVSTAAVTWPLFSVTASQGAQAPEVDSTVAAQWPMFATTANQVSVAPQYSSVAAITWPMFTASASQQSTVADGQTIIVTWPMFTASGSQASTVPAFTASVAAQWPMFTASAISGERVITPVIDLPISGYGNNRLWKESIFFNQ